MRPLLGAFLAVLGGFIVGGVLALAIVGAVSR